MVIVGEILDEFLGEDVLADGNKDGATELLGEEHQGKTEGNILTGKDGLRGQLGRLHPWADAEAVDDLVADPGCGGGRGGEGCEEAGTDGDEDRSDKHGGNVIADLLCDEARGYGGEDKG